MKRCKEIGCLVKGLSPTLFPLVFLGFEASLRSTARFGLVDRTTLENRPHDEAWSSARLETDEMGSAGQEK